jgi:hypothetical protein
MARTLMAPVSGERAVGGLGILVPQSRRNPRAGADTCLCLDCLSRSDMARRRGRRPRFGFVLSVCPRGARDAVGDCVPSHRRRRLAPDCSRVGRSPGRRARGARRATPRAFRLRYGLRPGGCARSRGEGRARRVLAALPSFAESTRPFFQAWPTVCWCRCMTVCRYRWRRPRMRLRRRHRCRARTVRKAHTNLTCARDRPRGLPAMLP